MPRPGLDVIVRRKKIDLTQDRLHRPLESVRADALRALRTRDFAGALRAGGVSVIAELKKASPSAGLLRPVYNPAYLAREYARAGARALSVLTEANFFRGSLEDLSRARETSGLPALRKDFIVDEYQVYEARAAGADAVLLIAAILSDWKLRGLMTLATRLRMTPLVEVHDEPELRRALDAGAAVIGVNSRNLKDLTIDLKIFGALIPKIPKDRLIVAESGIKTAADVKELAQLGAQAVLVGESLLRESNPGAAARVLVEAGKI